MWKFKIRCDLLAKKLKLKFLKEKQIKIQIEGEENKFENKLTLLYGSVDDILGNNEGNKIKPKF